MERLKLLAVLLVSFVPALCAAAICSPRYTYETPRVYYGATLSFPIITKDPSRLTGYQFMLDYDPQRFKWRKFNLYFDGGISHFRSEEKPYYRTITIYSIAPVVRYTFKRRGHILPFLEFSIGAAYLNHTQIGGRNLGIHFAFQDRLGLGVLFGSKDQFIAGIHALHYSNGKVAEHNSGISVPLVLDLGYRFLGPSCKL